MSPKTTSILLIIPPFFDVKSFLSKELKSRAPIFTIPYGVLSLAAYVQAHADHKVSINVIDLNVKAYNLCQTSTQLMTDVRQYIGEEIRKIKPDIVGISALFNTCYPYLTDISEAIKQVCAEILVVIGGGLSTNLYAEILNTFPCIDAACYGEGEIPLCQLAEAKDRFLYLNRNSAWITRQSLLFGKKPGSIFVSDLDEIPFFNYSLIDIDDYGGREIDNTLKKGKARNLSIHTSRGCPYNCVFCASGSVHGKKVRYMSVEKVVSEVRKMRDELSMEVLAIDDDHFLADAKRAKSILNQLIDFNIRIEFPNGIAVYAIDEEVGLLLKKAGVIAISLAVESGSEYVLRKVIQKPLKLHMVKKAVDILRKNDISVHAGFVVGLPGELEVHRNETMDLILNFGFDWCYFNLAVPVAGSRLYKLCKKNGYLINDDLGDHITMRCNIRTPDIDPEYMEDKAYLMNLEANFVKNYNLFVGNYLKASLYFQNITEKYPDHAFAHYYLAYALERLQGEVAKIQQHRESYQKILSASQVWQRYAIYFDLK